MDIKTIGVGAVIVLGFGGLLWWGRNHPAPSPAQSSENKKSSLVASEELFDFGTISMAKGNVAHVFNVTNQANQNINLETIVTSCMCTTAYLESATGEKGPFGMPGMGHVPPANEIIGAGESREIKVVYDPAAHGPAGVGPVNRFITLADADGGTLQFEIKAVVTP